MEIGKVTVSGIEVLEVLHINITAAAGEHAKLILECMIAEEKVQEYLQLPKQDKAITIKEENTVLFSGYAKTVVCSVNQKYVQMTLTIMSATAQLDKEKKTRSFQNTKKTYRETAEMITTCFLHGKDEPIGEIAIQYRETDWEFLKRLASRCHAVLYADMTNSRVGLHWGIEEGMTPKQIAIEKATVRKNFESYSCKKENGISELSERDALEYVIESSDFVKVGDCISYEGKTLYIWGLECDMEQAAFHARYCAKTAAAFLVPEHFLVDLAGTALEGNIIDVEGEKVKVHLSADEVQDKEEAYWFPFSTMQSSADGSGWYYMPELSDCVKVCLPGWEERGAFAVSAVSTYEAAEGTEDMMSDTDVMYMRNPSGKQLQLTPEQIQADGGNGEAIFDMDINGNIHMESKNIIDITASETIELFASQSIEIQAANTIDIKADASGEILLNESGEIRQLGGRVNINSEG